MPCSCLGTSDLALVSCRLILFSLSEKGLSPRAGPIQQQPGSTRSRSNPAKSVSGSTGVLCPASVDYQRGGCAMDPGCSGNNSYQTPIVRNNPLVPVPVSAGSSGEGLPYAPEDWPCPGDVWSWKVGRRVAAGGYWVDRSLRPPPRLLKSGDLGSKHTFYSRILVERYVRKEFPKADVGAFFDSFIWKIPCNGDHTERRKGVGRNMSTSAWIFPPKMALESQSRISVESGGCKAGNKMCRLRTEASSGPLVAFDCDICCSEAGFCRDCCCILCCKAIDWTYGGYSFVRCEGIIDKDFICGHVAHLDCALRAYMAGAVGGSISLDVEYFCRRCDSKTDLVPHVSKILDTCKSLDSGDDIEKILNIALRILHRSENMKAKILWEHIQSVMTKLKSGVCLGDIWEEDNGALVAAAETGSASTNGITLLGTLDATGHQGPRDVLSELESSIGEEIVDGSTPDKSCLNPDHEIVAVKLEDEVDHALQRLRKSQESEYKLAEKNLYTQKDYLINLYHQLDVERSEVAQQISSENRGKNKFLLANVSNRIDQIKQEETKLREMMLISKGFGQVPKQVLKDYFSL